MSRTCRALVWVPIVFLLLMAGATLGCIAQTTQQQTTLTIAGVYEPPTLDPHATDSGTALGVIMEIVENLLAFKPGTAEISPCLAERYELSADGLTYTFHLRQGIQFTDGTPFNAAAVKLNIDRIVALGKNSATLLGDIARVDVIDGYTVAIVLNQPTPLFLLKLTAKAALHIISPQSIQDHATSADPWAENWVATHPVGTGPYKLVEWVPQDRVVLAKNPTYWRGWEGKHIDTIIRRTVPEYTTRKLLLQQGQADIIDSPAADDLANLRAIPGIVVRDLATLNTVWYLPIYTSTVMQNVHVRRALSWAFPYAEAVQIAGMGSIQLQGPVPSSVPGHDKNLFMYTTDLKKAADELTASGYAKGELSITLVHYTSDVNRRVFEVFQRNLRDVGIDLKLWDMDWGQFSPWANADAASKAGADIFHVEQWPDFPDPYNYVTLYFKNTEDFWTWYPRGYVNDDINRLTTEAELTEDQTRRNQLYSEVQQILVDDAVGIWAYQIGDALAMQEAVKGFVFTPANYGAYNIYEIYKE
jgi:peptide/nickel transport system substrate-binding protein